MPTPSTGVSIEPDPLIQRAQDLQRRAVQEQGDLLRTQLPRGREGLFAAPELRDVSEQLRQRAADPLGRGFGADLSERVRVQQATSGLGRGTGGARQEAATLTRAAQQRRLQAADQLQSLGGSQLRALGLASPLATDFAALGSLDLAGQVLEATRAAGQAQSQFSQDLFNTFRQSLTRGGVSISVGQGATGGGRTGGSFSASVGGGGGAGTGGFTPGIGANQLGPGTGANQLGPGSKITTRQGSTFEVVGSDQTHDGLNVTVLRHPVTGKLIQVSDDQLRQMTDTLGGSDSQLTLGAAPGGQPV